jgi:hypothetical protein
MIRKIFNKQKIKYFVIILLVMTTFLTVAAYLTDVENEENSFTSAIEKMEIAEEFDPPKKLTPGISFIKKPKVINRGTIPCYVRAFAEVDDSTIGDYISIDYDMTNWTKKNDGYYYYNKILNPNEETEPLFTTVNINKDIEENKLKDFNIILYCESVQSEGYKNIEKAFKLERKRGS